jgi:hypothetical protein
MPCCGRSSLTASPPVWSSVLLLASRAHAERSAESEPGSAGCKEVGAGRPGEPAAVRPWAAVTTALPTNPIVSRLCPPVFLQAAVQSLAPGGVFLGLGLLELHSALHPSLSAVADANGLLQSTAGFLAWWAGLSWFVTCALELWLFRTGTLQN